MDVKSFSVARVVRRNCVRRMAGGDRDTKVRIMNRPLKLPEIEQPSCVNWDVEKR